MELWNLILFGLDICMLRIPFAYRRTSRHSGYGPLRPPRVPFPIPPLPPLSPPFLLQRIRPPLLRGYDGGYNPLQRIRSAYSQVDAADSIRLISGAQRIRSASYSGALYSGYDPLRIPQPFFGQAILAEADAIRSLSSAGSSPQWRILRRCWTRLVRVAGSSRHWARRRSSKAWRRSRRRA